MYRDDFDQLITAFEGIGSCDVTRHRLCLSGNTDSTTGWYTKFYVTNSAEAVIVPQASARVALRIGYYVRDDAAMFSSDPWTVGDVAETEQHTYYEVKTVKPHRVGDHCSHYSCDLTYLPMYELHGAGVPSITVEDARYRTKTYLDGYLENLAPANWLVAYDYPDYPLVRVFQRLDIAFSVGQPNSTPLPDPVQQAPYGYEEHVPLEILCMDKTNVSATKLMHAAHAEVRRVLENYPTGSRRSLEESRPTTLTLGSHTVRSVKLVWNYRRNTA